MLWVKSLHIVFVASWFAGLFYLPRIFVNLALVARDSVAERERLLLMARKLLRFTDLAGRPGAGLRCVALAGVWHRPRARATAGCTPSWSWCVLAIGYHHACGVLLRRFGAGGPHAQP